MMNLQQLPTSTGRKRRQIQILLFKLDNHTFFFRKILIYVNFPEGQLPRGAAYIESEPKQYRPRDDRPPIASPGDIRK